MLADNTLYLSGQIGLDPTTIQLRDGVEAQTRQAMENIGNILDAAGMNITDGERASDSAGAGLRSLLTYSLTSH